ncbi:TasA family protein [Oceanobacillus kapialis]|uniref:TasA family protein n=1 Tax=Oceanobacillus kapialis TaxID=481353 RepID=A0ABW5PWD6_9BACI
MGLKKRLGMGVATAALGISLVGGGTFAYFSDAEVQTNSFAAGTLDLSVDPEVTVDVGNLKPGDTMQRAFDLVNDGSLAIGEVSLGTEYTVTDAEGNPVSPELAEKYGDTIIVDFLRNTGGKRDYEVIGSLSLNQLANMDPDEIDDVLTETGLTYEYVPIAGGWAWHWVISGEYYYGETLEAGERANFDVKFRFNETGEPQNDLQGLQLDLNWTFNGMQTEGEEIEENN